MLSVTYQGSKDLFKQSIHCTQVCSHHSCPPSTLEPFGGAKLLKDDPVTNPAGKRSTLQGDHHHSKPSNHLSPYTVVKTSSTPFLLLPSFCNIHRNVHYISVTYFITESLCFFIPLSLCIGNTH